VWIATGAGDSVEAAEPLGQHAFVIVPQPFELSTADVYREADRLGEQRSDAELASSLESVRTVLSLPGGRVPAELAVNDLEPAALSLRPEIADVLDRVRAAGAESGFVSGSGPTVAGLMWGEDADARADAVAAELSDRYPGACAAVPVSEGFGQPSPRSGTIRQVGSTGPHE
jgi:4-diphosphocytidyl-2-C-methyl-D-erythritol kinase